MPVIVSLVAAQKTISPALSSLVESERAFARTSVERGVRESFLMFFADDGINFQPHPTKTREAFLQRPAPATRPPIVLNWQPIYADVAKSGDLGYTTGPYTLTDNSPAKNPTQYGFYFSIWKKQNDGSWKVAVDCGIKTPDHSHQKFEFRPAPDVRRTVSNRPLDRDQERTFLMKLDRQFDDAARSLGTERAFLKYLDERARLHRNGIFPVIGLKAIQSYLRANRSEIRSTAIKADVSESDDLGYTYGSYELRSNQKDPEKGYYVRVWKRDVRGSWKIVLDTLSPIPPENK